MLIYCKKCETPNKEEEAFCTACNHPLKAIPVPKKSAPWKKVQPGGVPSYLALHIVSSAITIVGLLCLLPLPVLGVVSLVSLPSEEMLVSWAILGSVFLGGVLLMGFAELLDCVRDIAKNSYR